VVFLESSTLVVVMEVCCKFLRIIEQTYTFEEKIILVLSKEFFPISSTLCKEVGMPMGAGWKMMYRLSDGWFVAR
jgi:hypothetical protein